MKNHLLVLLFAIMILLTQSIYSQPSVSVDKPLYDLQETIVATFSNGPNNATDWIGIYHAGEIPGDVQSTLWFYVNGTQSATSGITDGSVTFEGGLLEKGMYYAGFLENDGYTLLDSVWFQVDNLSDSTAPPAPSGNVINGEFYNLVNWTDVPAETLETYNIYASVNPITDLNAEGVELVGVDIGEGAESFEHVLRSANIDRERTYYYAITCKDLADNVGDAGTMGPITNTAKGVPTVSVEPPDPFVADGDMSEWLNIRPFVMSADSGTANVPSNFVVEGDADLSAEVRLAVDNEYLYVMMEMTDDAYYHPLNTDPWERDEPDLYIGLYNLTKAHVSYESGSTPDYQLRFDSDRIRLDAVTDDSLFIPIGDNYAHTETLIGYSFEARIPLADLETKRQAGQTAVDTISLKIGDKIPFNVGINDNDSDALREGLIFYATQVTERSFFDVSSWTYTWISDEVTDVTDKPVLVNKFELKQNYPNPFNPNTRINYSVAQPGLVNIKVFDVLGNQVAELVNDYKDAGNYTLDFSAGSLNLASGVYVYKLQAGDFTSARKMLLLK